jgi:4-hydroxy-3-methylbut-2-enyl diphosphate reductase
MSAPSTSRADPPGRPSLRILLAAPRGFCAGVDRAIQIVELALEKYGAPVYVRHEIVHNRFVVENLRQKGAIFVEELDEIPDTGAPVIFSAHGVPKAVPAAARARRLFYLDATCPLVSKVHVEAERHHAEGREIVLIGHAGHPEVIGTMGQLPEGAVSLLETTADAQSFAPRDPARLAFITQTTLSVDDTAEIVRILKQRFPAILGPHKEDICYATTNRQAAVKALAPRCDRIIVVGAPNSSNSLRLVEVARRAGCPLALLLARAADIPWPQFEGIGTLGITAGASAPEVLVDEMIDAFRQRFEATIETISTAEERIAFNVPRELRAIAGA